ncbi:xylose isomerase-like protein [Meira miltonrushii]|uniref:Xylose isomerase-like protein n=1 Tax=Meira miltonrushii TaxID=1280837 RepID=A0A316V1G5_9BASI|nr:xylose isomerase-like protein [Meira miltonrushii]PWN31397.1 xylose isomerase-like protein [Meira miltonrushii]
MHLCTHTWMRPESLEETLARASKYGYTSIELAGEPEKYPIEQTLASLKKYGMQCWGTVTIMRAERDLLTPDPVQRANTIAYQKQIVQMSADLGGKIVTITPSIGGKIKPSASVEEEWKWAVESIKEVCKFAQTKSIKIAIEPINRFETYFINRVDEAIALVEAIQENNCGIAIDTFHLNIEETNMFEAIEKCGKYLFDVHLGDNNRSAPGDGRLDWKKIITALKDVGYTGALAMEACPPIDRTPSSRWTEMGGQLERSPISVSDEELQFLQEHASGVLSETSYTHIVKRTAETILPLIQESH